MTSGIRVVAVFAFALAAVLCMPPRATAQVRVGVFVGGPVVAAPVVVAPAPRVFAPVPYPYVYSPFYRPYAFGYPYAYGPYWGVNYGVNFGFGRFYGPRAFAFRGGVGRRWR
jgi:hypothetical protein